MTGGLREKLIEIQKERGWVDREMADRLGITNERWRQVRTGICRELGQKIINGAAKSFPELSAEILAELRDAT